MKFLRACIVGSGPSGFYTAKMLMKLYQNVKVDMFESLPVPFGLVRYGVAPDHVNVKNVENTFRGIASDERFSFYGNVTIGNNRIAIREFNNKVSVEELKKWYSVVVFCVGASGEKKLNLPGEQLQHVYTSSSFVDWYNGMPMVSPNYSSNFLNDNLGNIKHASIIGQGNVALDCARMLMKSTDLLSSTDIPRYSLDVLKELNMEKVNVIGRRGAYQAQFSVGEVREIFKLGTANILINSEDLRIKNRCAEPGRRTKRLVKLLNEYSGKNSTRDSKIQTDFQLMFFRRPIEILPHRHDKNKIGYLKLEKMRLTDNDGVIATGEYDTIKCDLLISSIGYRANTLTGLPNITKGNCIPNNRGKIVFNEGNDDYSQGLYACGWFRRGPSGVILTNIEDASVTVKGIMDDIVNGKIDMSIGTCNENEKCILSKIEGIDPAGIVTWDDFLKIDRHEILNGKNEGKRREKILDINDMIAIAKS
jgi:adrenodoxin-NADP+ reductase